MIKAKLKPWDGKSVRMPGILSGLPIKTYHAKDAAIEPSIGSSGLKKIFLESPKHYWATSPLNPKAVEEEKTDALRFGGAAHHLLFGEADFNKLYAVPPPMLGGEPFSLRRTVCRVWREQREAEGKSFVRPEEMETIVGMRDSLASHPLIKAGILNGLIETSLFCKHKQTGVWLKARPDAVPTDSLDFVDLKTIAAIDYHSLENALYRFGYFIQAGLVAMIVQELLGQMIHSFTFVFIEKKAPFDIAVVTLKDNEIARGIKAAEKAIATFADCLKRKEWPGRYADKADAFYVEMAPYHQQWIDARIG
jgi:hypothetical protein